MKRKTRSIRYIKILDIPTYRTHRYDIQLLRALTHKQVAVVVTANVSSLQGAQNDGPTRTQQYVAAMEVQLKKTPSNLTYPVPCPLIGNPTSILGISTSYSEDLLVDMCLSLPTSTWRVRRSVYSPTLSTGNDALRFQPPSTCTGA